MRITIVGAILIVAAVAVGVLLVYVLTENKKNPDGQQNAVSQDEFPLRGTSLQDEGTEFQA